nr:M23 family metallopeptidase [uncultured Sphingomonas sp.]
MVSTEARAKARRVGNIIVLLVMLVAAWVFYNGISSSRNEGQVTSGGAHDPLGPLPDKPNVVVREQVSLGPSGLAVPVAGVRPDQLVDTFTQARAGGARVHDAIDITAPEGTPVVSAADGMVEKLYFSHGGGGISAYVRSADGMWEYYYAHLQAYDARLREGMKLKRGDAIGLVGHTGNASPDGPHLHFAINRMAPGERWSQGTPVNPYPLLAGNAPTR